MTNYDKIARDDTRREENYLRAFSVITGLYPDETHFVFELLQNADDNKSTTMELRLDEKEMIVWNDGSPFTEEDVHNICAIGSSNKDLTQIGTFGIGFKAVYCYTDCPEIYSGDERFRIHHFTDPEGINDIPPRLAEPIDQDKTVFCLPFSERLDQEDIATLKNRLYDLKKETLLFLRHLKTVKWRVERDVQTGNYFCHRHLHDKIENALKVELVASQNCDDRSSETFLVFRKEILPPQGVIQELLRKAKNDAERDRIQRSAKKLQPVDVAFKLSDGQIVAVDSPVLFAYLPTQKKTYLRFLIQARYQTTPARDNIRVDTSWNNWLVEETANFLPEILEQLKVGGFLDPAFFNVLPLDQDHEGDESHPIFKPIAESLKKAMTERSFIPTQNDEHAKAKNVFYPHNDRLSKLIDSSSICPGSSWLHSEIRRNTRAHNVMLQAGVKEVSVSQVLDWLEEQPLDWFEDKPKEWLCSLYFYLSEQRSELERIKKLPLVRLENGNHLCAESEAVFFSPSTTKEIDDIKPFLDELPILSSTFVTLDDQERNNIEVFLRNLGVKASHPENIVREGILPLYSQADESHKPSVEQNRLHLGYLFEVRDEILREEPYSSLKEEISKTPILLAYCKDSDVRRESSEFMPPEKTYLSQTYTDDPDLDTYFSVCDNVWFVDDGYLESDLKLEVWTEFLKRIGAKDYPRFIKEKSSATYEECGNRGFERGPIVPHRDNDTHHYIVENCLEGVFTVLDEVSKHPGVEFSKTLWCLLVKAVSSDEQSKRNDLFESTYYRFYGSGHWQYGDALFYLHLKKYAWLPDEQRNFRPPSNCFDPKNREVLGDSVAYLHSDFNLSSEPARWLAEKLGVHLKADTDGVLGYLQTLSFSDREVCVNDVKPLYSFLAEQDGPLGEKFQEEPLIFTPNPEPRWWLAHKVFWEDEGAVFDNSRGYLKTYYGDALKSFFSDLGVSERASPLDYVRAIRDTASGEQAGDKKVRERVKTLYQQLAVYLGADRFANDADMVEWEGVLNGKCWLGKNGSNWDFFFRHELVWNDHPQRAAFFEDKVPFWPFGDDLSNLAEYLEIVGSSQAEVEFHSHGDKIKDRQWSERVRELYPYIHAFLKSPQLGNEKESEPAKILTRLSVCRVAEFEVTYKLNEVHVTDPEPRPSFLDSTDLEATLWLGLDSDIDEFPELIGDAMQDYFGTKELGGFIEDLLTKNQERVLSRWEAKGLDSELRWSSPQANTEGNIEDNQYSNDGNLSSETQSEDTNLEEDDPSIEDQTIVDTPGMSSGHENSSEDEFVPQIPHPNTGGSRPGGGHWGNSSGGGGYGGHGGGGGGGEDQPHKELKMYLAENPSLLGEGLECEATEYEFTSQDKADILLIDDNENPVTVEVESHIPSGNYVGVWQAVKYKHLAAVEYELPCEQVRSILAAPEIPYNVKMECRRLGIEPREITRQ